MVNGMNAGTLQQWMAHPELLNRETLYELRTLVSRYPYFQTLRLLYLKNLYLLHDISFGAELRKAALYVADRRVLFELIEGDRFVLALRKQKKLPGTLQGEEPSLDRTLSLIDAFLSTIPEEQQPVPSALDYTGDYTSFLLQEEVVDSLPSNRLRGQDLIDGFIEKSEAESSLLKMRLPEEEEELSAEPLMEETPVPTGGLLAEEDDDESCFTETLAKIYIKQQRYDKALEIIKKLSLKYPKKNAYFADQIRFLEKLIINAKSK